MYATRQGKEIVRLAGDIQPANGGLLTVVIGGYDSLEALGDAFERWKRDARTLVRGKRSASARWNTFHLVGWLEVDALGPDHLEQLGSQRRTLLASLGVRSDLALRPIWIATVHALAFGERLEYQEIREAFATRWPVQRQTHLAPLRKVGSISRNIRNIVNYALKYRHHTKVAGEHVEWPADWMVEFYEWLHVWSTRSFLRTRVVIKPPVGHFSRKPPRRQ